MNTILEKLYHISPYYIHNLFISLYNIKAYWSRCSGNYIKYRRQFRVNNNLSLKELKNIQLKNLKKLLKFSINNSQFYQKHFKNIDLEKFTSINDLHQFTITNKEMFRSNIKDIYTVKKSLGVVSKTGGTTGKSLEVIFTYDNMQERYAMLDNFRSNFGYELGKKTAWFSGKNLLTKQDIKNNRFWKTDIWYHVRYYSTFHIKENYLKYYIEDLIKFSPEFMVGFPSTMAEIARYGLTHNIIFPKNCIKAVFPTAETVTDEIRINIETFFNTKLYNQYASSEGAPFIIECVNNRLHLELQSGVFEVLDENNEPTKNGRLVVTSFTTYGAPLIRYDIGDRIELSDEVCTCGNHNPLVKQIFGRIDDYLYSPENGKINLGNVSNTLKDIKGIIRFQAIQDELDKIEILVEVDSNTYTKVFEKIFIQNWRDRIGAKMLLDIKYVEDIPVEKSGKYRIVKNRIKHLID